MAIRQLVVLQDFEKLFPENSVIELKISSMKQVYFKNALFGLWLNYLQDNVAYRYGPTK